MSASFQAKPGVRTAGLHPRQLRSARPRDAPGGGSPLGSHNAAATPAPLLPLGVPAAAFALRAAGPGVPLGRTSARSSTMSATVDRPPVAAAAAAVAPPPAAAAVDAAAAPPLDDVDPATLRVVSLLPSATEIVCALGLHPLGVTHECDYPPDIVRGLPVVTSSSIPADAASCEIDALVTEKVASEGRKPLYSLIMPVVERLAPTAIVTQALCDVCAVDTCAVERAAAGLPSSPTVINLEPSTLGEVIDSITTLAVALGVPRLGRPVVDALNARVNAVRQRTAAALTAGTIPRRRRVFIAEWIDPLFTCGHWTPELVDLAGGVEVAAVAGQRSARSSVAALVPLAPEVLFVALCGFGVERSMQDVPILQAAPGFDDLPAAVSGDVYVTDGNAYFSRSGPRLVDSLEILAHTLYPEVHPLPPGLPRPVRVGKKGGGG